MTSLAKIRNAGFAVLLTDAGDLKINPFSKLDDAQRAWLKEHKAEIIAELQAESAKPESTYLRIAREAMELERENQAKLRHEREEKAAFISSIEDAEYREVVQAKPANDLPDIEPQPGDRRRFCRQCQHHSPVYGRAPQVIRCSKLDQVQNDDWPRNCGQFETNGQPIPIGVRWTPDTPTGTKSETQANEYPKPITCYTPAGNPVSVMATDSKHEAQLKRWNPPKAKP